MSGALRPAIVLAFAAAYAVLVGKDLNWDALNYHLYAGMTAWQPRFDTDFLGAGLPGYANPVSLVPFYLMVDSKWGAAWIAIALAGLHALNLILTGLLAERLLADCPGETRHFGAWAAMAFAALNPVFLQCLGSSFNDPLVSLPVLAGWLVCCSVNPLSRWPTALLAGVLLGLGAGLKLSNAIFALALLPLIAAMGSGLTDRIARVVAYGVGGVLGVVVAAGPWAWRLWNEFGNPVFPFLNDFFHSPDIFASHLKHLRFIPQSFADAMLRPFYMTLPVPNLHIETSAPDSRYAILFFLPLILFLVRGRKKSDSESAQVPPDVARPGRLRRWSTLSFCLAWCFWLAASGNSRYFLSMSCVASAILAVALLRMSDRTEISTRGLKLGTTAIIAVLAIQLGLSADLRWASLPWGSSWFEVEMPEALQREQYLYLSTDTQSASYLAAFLNPASGFINISGGYILGPSGPGGLRAIGLMDKAKGRIRTLTADTFVYEDGRPVLPTPARVNQSLRRFDLAIDEADCLWISSAVPGSTRQVQTVDVVPREHPARLWVASCAVVQDPGASSRDAARQAIVDEAFNRIERACPALMQPPNGVTEGSGRSWRRVYMNSDVTLMATGNSIRLLRYLRAFDLEELGTIDQWLSADRPPLPCPA